MLHYYAVVAQEDNRYVGEFPDCPGCVTQSDSIVELRQDLIDALHGWLEATMEKRNPVLRPSFSWLKEDHNDMLLKIPVDVELEARLEARWGRSL